MGGWLVSRWWVVGWLVSLSWCEWLVTHLVVVVSSFVAHSVMLVGWLTLIVIGGGWWLVGCGWWLVV